MNFIIKYEKYDKKTAKNLEKYEITTVINEKNIKIGIKGKTNKLTTGAIKLKEANL